MTQREPIIKIETIEGAQHSKMSGKKNHKHKIDQMEVAQPKEGKKRKRSNDDGESSAVARKEKKTKSNKKQGPPMEPRKESQKDKKWRLKHERAARELLDGLDTPDGNTDNQQKQSRKAHRCHRGGVKRKRVKVEPMGRAQSAQSNDMEVRGEVERLHKNGKPDRHSPYLGVYPNGIPLSPNQVNSNQKGGQGAQKALQKRKLDSISQGAPFDPNSQHAQLAERELEPPHRKKSKNSKESAKPKKQRGLRLSPVNPTPTTNKQDALLRTITDNCGREVAKSHNFDLNSSFIEWAPTPVPRSDPGPVSETVYPSVETPHSETPILPYKKSIPTRPIATNTAKTTKSVIPTGPKALIAAKFKPQTNGPKVESGKNKVSPSSQAPANRALHGDNDGGFSEVVNSIKKICQMGMLFGQITTPAASNPITSSNTVASGSSTNFWSAGAGGSPNPARTNTKRIIDNMLADKEEWEVTGGKVRGRVQLAAANDDDAEVEENIAFSSLYISNRNKPISIANVKFQIGRLKVGQNANLEGGADKNGVAICSVSRGRVKVNVGGKKFNIGENGMWRVRGGENCEVRNQFSEDAVVHVSTVN